MSNELVRIIDPTHPHYPETGRWTGEVIKPIWGGKMCKIELDHCKHGVSACYVSPGQIERIPEPGTSRRPGSMVIPKARLV